MAIKELAPYNLLDRFSNPLWKRLGLTGLEPLWIVRGQRRGYEWMVIELLQRNSESSDTTTVFLVRLPRKSTRWNLPGSRITEARQVCVDDEWVYVAELGGQPRVRDWHRWLDIAIDTADEVVRTASTHPVPRRHYRMQDGTKVSSSHPSWNPYDRGCLSAWLVLMLPVGGSCLLVFITGSQEWLQTGVIARCNLATHMGHALSGWKAVTYLGISAIPLICICRMVHTMYTRIYKPAFMLQLSLEGALMIGVALGAARMLEALEWSARGAC